MCRRAKKRMDTGRLMIGGIGTSSRNPSDRVHSGVKWESENTHSVLPLRWVMPAAVDQRIAQLEKRLDSAELERDSLRDLVACREGQSRRIAGQADWRRGWKAATSPGVRSILSTSLACSSSA